MLRSDQPLWLPRGSIRSILALAVTAAFILGLIETDIAMLVLGSYFVGRATAKSEEGNAEDARP
jgi:hypothetical protein